LRVGEEKVLREWTRASSGSAGLAQRARILLLAAQGHSNTEIARMVGVSLPTVRLWRSRYGAGGVGGLGDLPRSGRPVVHDETSIIAATLDPGPRARLRRGQTERSLSALTPTSRPPAQGPDAAGHPRACLLEAASVNNTSCTTPRRPPA